MTPWTTLPEASRLLASLAERPPRQRTRTDRFGDTWTTYTGQRVAALRCLYQAAEPPIDTPAWRVWLACDEQWAIAQAIEQSKMMEAAE